MRSRHALADVDALSPRVLAVTSSSCLLRWRERGERAAALRNRTSRDVCQEPLLLLLPHCELLARLRDSRPEEITTPYNLQVATMAIRSSTHAQRPRMRGKTPPTRVGTPTPSKAAPRPPQANANGCATTYHSFSNTGATMGLAEPLTHWMMQTVVAHGSKRSPGKRV